MNQRDYDKRAIQRFWNMLDAPDESGCRKWQGKIRKYSKLGKSKGKPSYGVLWYQRREVYAHIFAAQHILGHETSGMHVSHTCHHKWCCNPAHLIIETPAQNVARSVAAGHYNLDNQERIRVISIYDADDIRTMYAKGVHTQADIAHIYDISQSIVSHIVRGKSHLQ